MVVLALARWLLSALLRFPASWGVLGLAAGAGWLLPGLSPGVRAPGGELAWLARWGLPAGLAGVALAMHLLRHHCDFLARAVPAASWAAHGLCLVAAAAGAQAALTLGWWSSPATTAGPSPGLAAGFLVQDLHLAALGLVLLVVRLPPATGALALVVLVSTAAAWTSDGGRSLLAPLVDAAGHPARFATFARDPKTALLHAAPVAAWILCSWLARSPTAGSTPDPAA